MNGERLIDELFEILQPTSADLTYAGNVIKSGILRRTEKGLDWQGKPFAPYSQNGPFYYYPAGGGSASSVSRTAKRIGGTVSRTGKGIRFESYDAFKRSLGRRGVDLRGPSAPHMLQAIVVQVRGGIVYIGIYDEFAAAKADGHNRGANRLPQREFFEASDDDIAIIAADLAGMIVERGRKFIGS